MQVDNNTPGDEQDESPSRAGRSSALKRYKFLILGIATIVIMVAAVIFAIVSSSKQASDPSLSGNKQAQTTGDPFVQQYGSTCKTRDITFTSGPMKSSDLAYIRPLGAVGDGHVTPTDHVYVGPPNPAAADNTYPVLMPADGTVVQIDEMPAQYIGDKAGQQVAPEDHRIVISHSCRYFSIYIHVHKLSDTLQTAAGSLQPGQNKQVAVDLKAGDIVGYIGGSTFDWIPIDTGSTLKGFITPSLYSSEPWKIHTVSPFDLYTGALKSELEGKSLRTAAPLGGKIDYDQPGKLVGNWFREGTGGYAGNNKDQGGRYWDGHLSVAPDYVDPGSTIVSTGSWNGAAAQFVVSGSVDPSKVTSSDGLVKYELKQLSYVTKDNQPISNMPRKGMHPSQSGPVVGTIAFQVLDGEKLKVETFPNKTASQVNNFSAAAQTYER